MDAVVSELPDKIRNHNRAKLFWMSANLLAGWLAGRQSAIRPTIFLLSDNFLSLFCGLPQSNVKIATQRFISSKTEQTAQHNRQTDRQTDGQRVRRSAGTDCNCELIQSLRVEGSVASVSWSGSRKIDCIAHGSTNKLAARHWTGESGQWTVNSGQWTVCAGLFGPNVDFEVIADIADVNPFWLHWPALKLHCQLPTGSCHRQCHSQLRLQLQLQLQL